MLISGQEIVYNELEMFIKDVNSARTSLRPPHLSQALQQRERERPKLGRLHAYKTGDEQRRSAVKRGLRAVAKAAVDGEGRALVPTARGGGTGRRSAMTPLPAPSAP